MTVTADVLQGLVVAALLGPQGGPAATGAGVNVFSPRDWPTTTDEMPIILVQSPSETKESLGRSGAQQFTVTATIRVVARVKALAQTGDQGAMAALAAIGVLQRQIEVAVINDYDLDQVIQQIASVAVKNGVSSEAEVHVAELVMDFAFEFYQGPEDFAPVVATPIDQLAVFADLVNVFSPTDTFDPALEPFTAATPAPRTEGPDGRPEASISVDFTGPVIDSAAELDFSDPGQIIQNTIV